MIFVVESTGVLFMVRAKVASVEPTRVGVRVSHTKGETGRVVCEEIIGCLVYRYPAEVGGLAEV